MVFFVLSTQAFTCASILIVLEKYVTSVSFRKLDRITVKQFMPVSISMALMLFTSGKADLNGGTTGHLDRLVAFLNHYTDRTVMIVGYTDSVGSQDYNQGLSERRAQSVSFYLNRQGIDAARLSSAGRGESDPIAGNDTASGRQQNRRVEVTISNPKTASR